MANIQKRPDGRWRARYRDEVGQRTPSTSPARPKDNAGSTRSPPRSSRASTSTPARARSPSRRTPSSGAPPRCTDPPARRTSRACSGATSTRSTAAGRSAASCPRRSRLGSSCWASAIGRRSANRSRRDHRRPPRGRVRDIPLGGPRSPDHGEPVRGTRLPRVERRRIVPLTTTQVGTLRDELPDELKALVTFAAGTGMRQGEIFGLTRDRLRLLGPNPVVVVDRQLLTRLGRDRIRAAQDPGELSHDPAACDRRRRPQSALGSGHRRRRPGLDPRGAANHPTGVRPRLAPSRQIAGLNAATGPGMHALRHYYASLLIRYGESVKTVQTRLGHASAVETLDTYSHLWPDSDDRTRDAIDSVLGRTGAAQPKLDEPLTVTDLRDDLIDQRLEPCQQRGATSVADTDPHDGRCVSAHREHVGEVLILGHDDGLVVEGIAPEGAIRRIAWADVGDVLCDVAVFAQHVRHSRRQLGVDQEAHSGHEVVRTAWSACAAA